MIRGGLRSRLIADSVRVMIIASLEEMGWMDASPNRRDVRYIPKPEEWQDSIELNAFSITPEDTRSGSIGLGGEYEDRARFYVDIYAENEALGRHLSFDVRDTLLGKVSALGQHESVLDVYDFRQATPGRFTMVDIEDVFVDRTRGFPRPWQQNWFVVHFVIVDEFNDDIFGETDVPWTDEVEDAWDVLQAVPT